MGRERGQPSSTLAATIGAFRAGRPVSHQRLCWHKACILSSGAGRFPGEVPSGYMGTAGPWVPGPSLGLQAPSQLLLLSGPQFPTCEPTLQAYA